MDNITDRLFCIIHWNLLVDLEQRNWAAKIQFAPTDSQVPVQFDIEARLAEIKKMREAAGSGGGPVIYGNGGAGIYAVEGTKITMNGGIIANNAGGGIVFYPKPPEASPKADD